MKIENKTWKIIPLWDNYESENNKHNLIGVKLYNVKTGFSIEPDLCHYTYIAQYKGTKKILSNFEKMFKEQIKLAR